MSIGRLATGELTVANTDTKVYTVPAAVLFADLDISLLNTNAADATVNVAIAAADVPISAEYIEKGVQVPASGGVLERTALRCSPGERVVVRSSVTGLVVRISGTERAAL